MGERRKKPGIVKVLSPDRWAGTRSKAQILESLSVLVSAMLKRISTTSPGPTISEGHYDENTMTWKNPNTGGQHSQRCNARNISDKQR